MNFLIDIRPSTFHVRIPATRTEWEFSYKVLPNSVIDSGNWSNGVFTNGNIFHWKIASKLILEFLKEQQILQDKHQVFWLD